MFQRIVQLSAISFLLLLLLTAFAWSQSPRLLAVSPAENAAEVFIAAPLQFTFDRPVRLESVQARFQVTPNLPGKWSQAGNTITFNPVQHWGAGQTISVTLQSGVQSEFWLALPTLRQHHWQFSISLPRLAYLYPNTGSADLYLLSPQSGSVERLTTGGNLRDYAVAADGLSIFYSTTNGQIVQLWRADGSTQTIVPCPQAACSNPRPSPDGKFLAYERLPMQPSSAGDVQVWLQPLPQGAPFAVEPQAFTTLAPFWSPQNLLTYYDPTRQTFTLWHPKDGTYTHFSNQTGEMGAWLPDGRAFIVPEIFLIPNGYLSEEGALTALPTSHLMQIRLAPSAVTDLTVENSLEDATPVVSPDARWLAFTRKSLKPAEWTPGRQIWLATPEGKQAQQMTNAPQYHHSALTWSPDSAQLAYVRASQTELGQPTEIWLMTIDSGSVLRLVIGGYAPQWVP
ncbi:MAG: hypothetical protein OHK0052_11900 [Anaerolineales bacterium]